MIFLDWMGQAHTLYSRPPATPPLQSSAQYPWSCPRKVMSQKGGKFDMQELGPAVQAMLWQEANHPPLAALKMSCSRLINT
eukprot:605349-Pelagomonas_calceolata.AAC.10